MFLKCSWILLFKFHKKLYSSFLWFIFLKPMPLYRFQILFYDAKTFVISFLLIFVFHEIFLSLLWDKLFLRKNLQINCYNIFNVAYVLEKYWYVLEVFLNCSWIFIAKIAGHPGKKSQKFEYLQNKKSFFD